MFPGSKLGFFLVFGLRFLVGVDCLFGIRDVLWTLDWLRIGGIAGRDIQRDSAHQLGHCSVCSGGYRE